MCKILIVDDIPFSRKILGDLLKEEYQVIDANNGKLAIDIALREQPDLILLDVVMPEMDGFEACEILKMNPLTTDIPVIFLTSMSTSEDVLKGFEVGGQDYIIKPFNKKEVFVRIKNHIDLKRSKEAIHRYAIELENKNLELHKMMRRLDTLAKMDYLTEIPNRRYGIEKIEEAIAHCEKNSSVFSLLMIDIDFFKSINDKYGHECGDYVLKEVSTFIKSCLRKEDMIARWGGEEFLILLADRSLHEATIFANEIRWTIEGKSFIFNNNLFSITITIGVTQYDFSKDLNENIRRADEVLYIGKNDNRNCVKVYTQG